ncbi:MAG: anti-sigma factor [Acidobacteria bacterium]|nr:anti-sigma factor [Acidobacteriota bacterium]MBI3424846.1 anti-sigma factor [Acidobacteriota bacterium]
MTQMEAKELVPLHALGALDAVTAGEVERYLRQASLEEQREAAEFREVAALLPFALLSPAVRPALKGQLLGRINEGMLASSRPATVTGGQVLEFKLRARAERSWSQNFSQWLAVAASLILAAASALFFWQNRQLKNERAQLAQRLQSAQQTIEQMQAPTTRVLALKGQEAPQASAKVFWDTTRHEWVMQVFNLPDAPLAMDYQLWYVTKDAKLSAAVFRPDTQGRAELRLSLPGGVAEKLAATAVTLEPRGGSPQPTGKFYLLAQI